MKSTLDHLLELTSNQAAVRQAGETHFNAMRLSPRTFVRELSLIIESQAEVPFKKLALSLLSNFVELQENPPHARQLLQLATNLYLRDSRIGAATVSKLLSRLLEKLDGKTQADYMASLLSNLEATSSQTPSVQLLQRRLMLLMEIYDDSERLVLPFDCSVLRQHVSRPDIPQSLKRLLMGVLAVQSVRTNFPVAGGLQLSQALNPMSFTYNKPATISFLVGFLERKLASDSQLLEVHSFLQSVYLATLAGECLEFIGLLSRLAQALFKEMLARTSFLQEQPFMRQEYILDYLVWVHALIHRHADADVLDKELLSNVAVFVVTGFECLLKLSIHHFTGLILGGNQQQPVDWKARNASYTVLAAISTTAAIDSRTDMQLLKLAVEELAQPGCIKLGILELLLAFSKKEYSANIVADEVHLAVQDLLSSGPELTVEEFRTAMQVLFCFKEYVGEDALLTIFQFVDGHDEGERMQFLKCIQDQFQLMEVTEEVLSSVLDVMSCYQHEQLPVRQLLLHLLAIVLGRFPEEFNSLFIDAYNQLRKIRPAKHQTAVVDAYCQAWCELLKIYNKSSQEFGKEFLNDSCHWLDFFFESASSDRLVQYLMEMIDLPPENMPIINRVRDMLVAQLPFQNPRLYDLLEVYVLLYPKRAEERSEEILRRLYHDKSYYRLYFRLPPTTPLKPPNFQPTSIVEVKWVLLAMLNSQGKLRDFQLSKETPALLESLTLALDRLNLEGTSPTILGDWIDLLREWKDNTEHWLAGWSHSYITHKLKRDFAKWTKPKLLQLLQLSPPMEIDY